MRELGDSLSRYKNLTVIEAESPDSLVKKISAINFPVDIISINGNGSKWVAFLNSNDKIRKKNKELDNGNSKE